MAEPLIFLKISGFFWAKDENADVHICEISNVWAHRVYKTDEMCGKQEMRTNRVHKTIKMCGRKKTEVHPQIFLSVVGLYL